QLMQLRHGGDRPELRRPNTWEALAALRDARLVDQAQYEALRAGWDFLLRVHSRLRIASNRTLDAVPDVPEEVEELARRLGFDGGAKFLAELDGHRRCVRELFLQLAGAA